jgi:perosamine synthetase
VNNGTVSLTLAAIAAGLVSGDEVLVPNYTMVATASSMSMIGASPVFVDVESSTLCMDLLKVEEKITAKTKALILVSANGRYPSAGINKFLALCQKYDLALIEDAAQSLGSTYEDGTHVGLKGLIGSISFSAPKIISTGQGGALITNNDEMAAKLRLLKDFGRSAGGSDIHDTIGFNFKFTELQAVVGLAQMEKLDFRVKRKKDIYRRYQNNLKNVSGIKFFDHNFKTTTPWFIDCRVDDRDGLQEFLKKKLIGTRVMYPPLNSQLAYKTSETFNVSQEIGANGLWLPSMCQLSDEQIDYISQSIELFYKV